MAKIVKDWYPNTVCTDCMKALGKVWPVGHIATWYSAECGVCGETKTCTELRDYGHLSREELKNAKTRRKSFLYKG